jgi:hypothetical protein
MRVSRVLLAFLFGPFAPAATAEDCLSRPMSAPFAPLGVVADVAKSELWTGARS